MILENKIKVEASHTDSSAQLGVVGAIAFLQDNMCEYFRLLGCDGITMIPICNSFFVITKTKINFFKNSQWLDRLKIKMGVFDKSKIRVNLISEISAEDGDVRVCGIQELCPIDKTTRRIRSVDSTLFPIDIKCVEGDSGISFSKFNFDDGDFVFSKEYEITLANVDFYMHTNNIEYVKFCMGALSDSVRGRTVKTFEIHYLKESVMGDKLKVFVCERSNHVGFVIKRNEEVLVLAEIVFTDKNI